MLRVTVIIPAFNAARFIADAIQSALEQTIRDFEIIVIDDGSTDGTDKVVDQFSNLVSYRRQPNQGAGVSRNLGVSLAKGEWIAFLDSDDVWYSNKLAVQFEHVRRYPDVGLFYSDMDTIDETGQLMQERFLSAKLERRKKRKRLSLVSLAFNGGPFPYPSTVLIRKDVFLQTGGFSPLFQGNYHEDFELFARIARISPIHFIPESLTKYRVWSKENIPGGSNRDANWLILLNRLRETWRGEPEKQAALDRYFAKHFSVQGERLLRVGEYRIARQYFRRVFSYRPFLPKNLTRWGLTYLPGVRTQYVKYKSNGSLNVGGGKS